jgi:uncharacterized membrane protein
MLIFKSADLSALPPAVVVHLAVALGALVLGPVALGLRKGTRGHRGLGYAWVTLMLLAAVSSIFIRDYKLPNLAGYTPIHVLTFVTIVALVGGIWAITQRQIVRHRRIMQFTYASLLTAGLFTLLPHRYLGSLLWHHTLGLV